MQVLQKNYCFAAFSLKNVYLKSISVSNKSINQFLSKLQHPIARRVKDNRKSCLVIFCCIKQNIAIHFKHYLPAKA